MIAGVGIGAIECKRITVAEEMFQIRNRNCNSEAFAKAKLHIDNADDLALVVKQWPAAVAGVDLSCRLNVNDAVHVPITGTHDTFGD